jgi:hypothetical protein
MLDNDWVSVRAMTGPIQGRFKASEYLFHQATDARTLFSRTEVIEA